MLKAKYVCTPVLVASRTRFSFDFNEITSSNTTARAVYTGFTDESTDRNLAPNKVTATTPVVGGATALFTGHAYLS
jgi:hypothetical protein